MKTLCKRVAASLVLASSYVGGASAQQFGAWSVGPIEGNEGVYAATMNDSQGVLGQYCYKEDGGSCLWLLKTDIDCTETHKYPVLINADAGSAHTELLCVKVGGTPRYVFTDFKTIDKLVKQSLNIGFALPMEDGYFKVSRFNLNGAAKAITYMLGIAEKIAEPMKNSGTRDSRL